MAAFVFVNWDIEVVQAFCEKSPILFNGGATGAAIIVDLVLGRDTRLFAIDLGSCGSR